MATANATQRHTSDHTFFIVNSWHFRQLLVVDVLLCFHLYWSCLQPHLPEVVDCNWILYFWAVILCLSHVSWNVSTVMQNTHSAVRLGSCIVLCLLNCTTLQTKTIYRTKKMLIGLSVTSNFAIIDGSVNNIVLVMAPHKYFQLLFMLPWQNYHA